MTVSDSQDFLDMLQAGDGRTSPDASPPTSAEDDLSGAPDTTQRHFAAPGRWESVVLECLRLGITDQRVDSLMRVLGWPDEFSCFTIAGTPQSGRTATFQAIRRAVHDLGGSHCLCGSYHGICISVIAMGHAVTPEVTCTAVLGAFADSLPLCLGPARSGVRGASASMRASLMALTVAPAVKSLQRPMRADDVLPERALMGDDDAKDELYADVYSTLRNSENADDPTLITVFTFLQTGGSLDATARELSVHPNTVRYRLKRAAETTGWDATDPREAYVLQTAIALGTIRDSMDAQDGTSPHANGRK